ncbi:hypothetical protein Bca52824_087954 [Brassica carinata]|uniref:Uncharacterized protein n=1 Tax=Brassica carinata TaxID=52824 RepID=A0A8X7TP51_BRACI|nr:hypothetical protein Bca52824_087954 [Brassica carinata]
MVKFALVGKAPMHESRRRRRWSLSHSSSTSSSFGLLATTATPTPPISTISLAPLFLGAAPLCPSGTNRSTHPECRLARSAASDPFIYVFSPFCCSPASSDSAAFHCRSDSDSSTTAANLRRSGRGGGSLSCKIESSTVRSPDPPTTSGYNHHLSPTFVNDLGGLDNVGNVPIEATPAHQGLYGDKLYRVDRLPSPTNARSCVDVRLVPPPVTHRSSSFSSVFQHSTDLRFSLGFNESYGYRYGNIGVLFEDQQEHFIASYVHTASSHNKSKRSTTQSTQERC